MNWCLLGTVCTAVPLLCCVRVTYGRADLDAMAEQVVIVQLPDNPSTQREHDHKNQSLSPSTSHNTTNDNDLFTDQSVDLHDTDSQSNSASGRRSADVCREPNGSVRISGRHSADLLFLTP